MEKSIKLQKIKRKRVHGFRKRQGVHAGQKVLKRRRDRKRHRLTI